MYSYSNDIFIQNRFNKKVDIKSINYKQQQNKTQKKKHLLKIPNLSEEPPSDFDPNAQDDPQTRERKYSNVSMEGLFSVDVLITALASIKLDALPLSHPKCQSANVCLFSFIRFTS